MTLPGLSATSRRDDLLARLAATGAYVDVIVRVSDHIQVVLNDHQRGPVLDQVLEYPQQGVFPSKPYTACVMRWRV